MLIRLIRFIRGYVMFSVTGRYPERFLNLCNRNGRVLFNPVADAHGFSAGMFLSDYRSIRPLARRARVRLKIKKRCGLPFLFARYKARVGLLIGMVLFIVIALVMQSFVWTVEINGAETISEYELTATLCAKGLYAGAFKGGMNLGSIQRDIMLGNEKIGWMSINIIGTAAEVEIREKQPKPEIAERSPCNIVADTDALIVSVSTRNGTAKVAAGSAVIKGQLLVSSVFENVFGDISYVHADAEVMAQTTHTRTVSTDKNITRLLPTGDMPQRKAATVFSLSIPFAFDSGGVDSYSSRICSRRVALGDYVLPLGVDTQQMICFARTGTKLDSDAAEKILRTDCALYSLFSLSDCTEVKVKYTFTDNSDTAELHASYTCIRDIAQKQKLIVN